MSGHFLLHVCVVVDVVHAVAVVAVALGAVAEFHLRIICISYAADAAFMEIASALLHLFLSFLDIFVR